jgi:mannose/fructose/sorbose-specific phosphotransferase system IIA component
MVGVVLAAHGPLPMALLESVAMIMGDLPQVTSVSLMPGDSLEGLVDRLQSAVNEVNAGQGVLILLDLFGGTPANAAALLSQQMAGVQAVSGVNLPMLLEMLLERLGTDAAVEGLAETAAAAGRAGVVNVVASFQQFRQGEITR